MKKLITVLALLLLGSICFGASGTVCKISDAFENNAISAKSMYGGRNVMIAGYVEDVGWDLFGNLQLTLKCSTDDFDLKQVVIEMKSNQESVMSQLQPNSWVNVTADFSGKMIFPFYKNGRLR